MTTGFGPPDASVEEGLMTKKYFQKITKTFMIIAFQSSFFYPPLSGAALSQNSLDHETVNCVKCHPSAISAAAAVFADVSDEPPLFACHDGTCDHLIGADYSVLASKNMGLVKPAALNPAIRLIDNRIGCTTCHQPYSESGHRMVAEKRKNGDPDPMLNVDNTASRLCTSCHMK